MDVTSRLGLKRISTPAADLVREIRQSINQHADVIDALYIESAASSRPAPAVKGRVHRATDTGVFAIDTGGSWEPIQDAGIAPVTSLPASPAAGQKVVLAAGWGSWPLQWVPGSPGRWIPIGNARAVSVNSSPGSTEIRMPIPAAGQYLVEVDALYQAGANPLVIDIERGYSDVWGVAHVPASRLGSVSGRGVVTLTSGSAVRVADSTVLGGGTFARSCAVVTPLYLTGP